MTFPRFVRHVVASRHVEKHEDWLVQDYLHLLRSDNARLQEELRALKPEGFTPSGRYVVARLLPALLFACALVAGAVWWKYSDNAAAMRKGFQEGWAAART